MILANAKMIKNNEKFPEDKFAFTEFIVKKFKQYAGEQKNKYELILAKAYTFIFQKGTDSATQDQLFKIWFSSTLEEKQKNEDKMQSFDFNQNEKLDPKIIIYSTFFNSEREKYPYLKLLAIGQTKKRLGYKICQKSDQQTHDYFIDLIQRKENGLGNAYLNCYKNGIRLYDTRYLKPEIDSDIWLKKIKSSKWYGPFKPQELKSYYFYTLTSDGLFDGICMVLDLDEQEDKLGSKSTSYREARAKDKKPKISFEFYSDKGNSISTQKLEFFN